MEGVQVGAAALAVMDPAVIPWPPSSPRDKC